MDLEDDHPRQLCLWVVLDIADGISTITIKDPKNQADGDRHRLLFPNSDYAAVI